MIVTDEEDEDPAVDRRPSDPRLTNKLAHAGLAGAVTTLVVFALNHLTGGEVALPGEVGAAVTAAVMFAVGWLVRERAPSDFEGADG